MGAVGIGMMVAGTVYNAYTQAQSASYNAEVARRNAKMSRIGAGDAMQRAQSEAQRVQMRGAQAVAAGRAGAAGGNIDAQSSTVLDVLGGSRFISKLDERVIENNAQRASWARMTEAENYRAQADASESAGRRAVIGTLLTGGAKAGMAAYSSGAFNETPAEVPETGTYTGMGSLDYQPDLFPVFGR